MIRHYLYIAFFALFAVCLPTYAVTFVACAGTNTVSVVNSVTGQTMFTIPVGEGASAIEAGADGSKVYVTNSTSNTVSVIDTTTFAVETISGFNVPDALAIDPAGEYVAVCNNGNNTVVAIEVATNTLGTAVEVGINVGPDAIVTVQNGGELYVCNNEDNSLSVVDMSDFMNPTIKVAAIAVGTKPSSIAATSDTWHVVVTNEGSNNISIVQTTNDYVNSTINVGTTPSSVAITANDQNAYVTNSGSNDLSIIDMSFAGFIDLQGASPSDQMVLYPAINRAYVSTEGAGKVAVIDTQNFTVVEMVSVGVNPYGLALSPDNSILFVTDDGGTNTTPGAIHMLNTSTNEVDHSITLYGSPAAIAVQPGASKAYVTNSYGESIWVLDTDTYDTSTITVGPGNSSRVLFNDSGSEAYVLNYGKLADTNPSSTDGAVSIINTATKAVTKVTIGNGPSDMALTEVNGTKYLVVTNTGTNTNSNFGTGTVSLVRLDNQTVDTYTAGEGTEPMAVVMSPNGKMAYVAYQGSGYIIGLWINEPRDRLGFNGYAAVSASPAYLLLHETKEDLYVVSQSGVVDVLGLDQIDDSEKDPIKVSIPVGDTPWSAIANADQSLIYVTNHGGNSLSIIDTSANDTVSVLTSAALASTLPVGEAPSDVVVDSSGNILIANQGSNTLLLTSGYSPGKVIPGTSGPSSITHLDQHIAFGYAPLLKEVESLWAKERFVLLAWEPIENAARYTLYRNGVEIASFDSSQTSYQDHNLEPSEQYLYTLKVTGQLGEVEIYAFNII